MSNSSYPNSWPTLGTKIKKSWPTLLGELLQIRFTIHIQRIQKCHESYLLTIIIKNFTGQKNKQLVIV
jgi:hypothetical protein